MIRINSKYLLLRICLVSILSIGGVYILMIFGGIIPPPTGENTTIVQKNLDRISFEISHTESDLIAKDDYYNVYIYDIKNNNYFWSDIIPRKKFLIFRYDPVSSKELLPTITSNIPNHIKISISSVSYILIKVDKWKGKFIDYNIGHIEYLAAG